MQACDCSWHRAGVADLNDVGAAAERTDSISSKTASAAAGGNARRPRRGRLAGKREKAARSGRRLDARCVRRAFCQAGEEHRSPDPRRTARRFRTCMGARLLGQVHQKVVECTQHQSSESSANALPTVRSLSGIRILAARSVSRRLDGRSSTNRGDADSGRHTVTEV